MRLNGYKKIILFSTFSLLLISPSPSFAWQNYAYYGDWNYHGSGRDHPYSNYIDQYYYIGYADYPSLEPDFIDGPLEQIPQLNPAPAAQPDQFTVNIPDKNGGYTAVVIKRSGNGFTGPQGEYYPEFPKVFQLEIMYGK
jgi:hypothetical protein